MAKHTDLKPIDHTYNAISIFAGVSILVMMGILIFYKPKTGK